MTLTIRVTKDERGEFYAAVVRPHKGYPNDVQEVHGVGCYDTEAEAREELILSLAEELVKLRADVIKATDALSRDLASFRKV